MKLANKAFVIALFMLSLVFSMTAQTLRSVDDPRNTAPTVGTGGPPGGPTGLFTVYDGQTLRRGEFTFSAAYSNYDRDPGDVDIVEVPVSFQVGLSDNVELFFNTDAYRAIKVNSPRNLSGFYLPNSVFANQGAIVLGSGQFAGQALFRPRQPFVQFPFIGGNTSSFIGSASGFSAIPVPTRSNGNGADNFPGLGSPFGSILPGVVLQTNTVVVNNPNNPVINPTVFTTAPSYLPDAPFINRRYAETSFNTFTVGGKIRFTGPNNPYGFGIIPFYRFYHDSADDRGGFNQLQRGASPGGGGPNLFSSDGGRGDFGAVLFGDARLRKYINVSANIGYIYNSSVKADLGGTDDLTILDRPDEVLSGIAVDFPVNRFFQPILEFRSTQYVGGRTPNAFENSPLDGLAGTRIFPARWVSIGLAYRYHFNQQDTDSFEGDAFSTSSTVRSGGTALTNNITRTTNFTGVPGGFRPSSDPHGFIVQFTAGRRNARTTGQVPNRFADVTNILLSETRVTIPCAEGTRAAEGANCTDDMSVNVTTTAVDPENDVLTYTYTVSGGRIVGQGANVQWDLTGAAPGTYTIVAGVDDGCGVCGKTQTTSIIVENCNCVAACECPTVSVTGPGAAVNPGDTMTFTANVSGGNVTDLTYNWTVTQGEIISGQGTPTITVQTTAEMGSENVTATVTTGSTICDCDGTASEIGIITTPPTFREIDRFGVLPNDEVRARVENFYIELNNDPSATGYIIIYGTEREITRRETQIRNSIRFRNLDPNRVTIVRGGNRGAGVETVFYVVPSGVTPPTPETFSTPPE
jgi:hypothetical protein